MEIDKTHKCPLCDQEIKTSFDGELVKFFLEKKQLASCGGIYESAIIKCPSCKIEIEFQKDELEKVKE